MRYYLGPWQNSEYFDFEVPSGVISAIDLRSIPGQASPSFGFFCVPDQQPLGEDYELFGQGHLSELFPSGPEKSRWASMLGINKTLESNTLLDLLWDTLGVYSDPSGDNGPKPILPTRRGNLELHLGGHSLVKSRRLTQDRREWAKIVDVVKLDLAKIRADSLDGKLRNPRTKQIDELMHRRVLQAMVEKYRCDWELLVPKGWGKNEKPEKHDTVITDNFNRADSSNTGSDWTQNAAFTILSNRLKYSGTNGVNIANTNALSSDDNYCYIEIPVISETTTWIGAIARGTSNLSSHYMAQVNGTTIYISRGSAIGSTSVTRTLPGTQETLLIECDGSNIRATHNGVLKLSLTDTNITGNLYTGLRCDGLNGSSSVEYDNFEAGDQDAGGGGTVVPALDGRMFAGGFLSMSGGLS